MWHKSLQEEDIAKERFCVTVHILIVESCLVLNVDYEKNCLLRSMLDKFANSMHRAA